MLQNPHIQKEIIILFISEIITKENIMRYVILIVFLVITTNEKLSAKIILVPYEALSIQEGIEMAGESDTVLVDDGYYFENINFLGKHITVASKFIIDGDKDHICNTTIDGSRPQDEQFGSVVRFLAGEDSNSVLTGFTVTGGKGTSIKWKQVWYRCGGGILILESGAKIEFNL